MPTFNACTSNKFLVAQLEINTTRVSQILQMHPPRLPRDVRIENLGSCIPVDQGRPRQKYRQNKLIKRIQQNTVWVIGARCTNIMQDSCRSCRPYVRRRLSYAMYYLGNRYMPDMSKTLPTDASVRYVAKCCVNNYYNVSFRPINYWTKSGKGVRMHPAPHCSQLER